uniref:Uncharacterized protein n=1 Tax=Rangifer tarandus platyrhynchus TaxID=3082113 RepID=A0ACB0FLV8_RANTA|nr:unnamed protein product [Rangifer tarandus platyrhynchus]
MLGRREVPLLPGGHTEQEGGLRLTCAQRRSSQRLPAAPGRRAGLGGAPRNLGQGCARGRGAPRSFRRERGAQNPRARGLHAPRSGTRELPGRRRCTRVSLVHRFSEIEERGTGGTFLGTGTWGRGHCFAVCALSPARVGRWRAKRGLIGGASGGEASGDGISGVGVGGAVGQPVPAAHVPSSSSAPLGSAQFAYGALWSRRVIGQLSFRSGVPRKEGAVGFEPHRTIEWGFFPPGLLQKPQQTPPPEMSCTHGHACVRWHFLSSGYRQKGGDGASARKLSGVPWLQAQPHPPAGSSGARGGFAAASARRRAHACSPELRPAGAVRICRRCPHLDWPRPDPGTPRPLALPAPARCPGPAQGRAPRGCPTHRLRAAGLPSGPRGLRAAARRLAPSHRSGTRPPRPLGNSLQGDRAPPPAPTPGTEPTCAGVCGVPVPPAHAPPRPAPGFVREGRSRPGGAGAGEEGAFRGAPDPAAEAEAAGRARVVLL